MTQNTNIRSRRFGSFTEQQSKELNAFAQDISDKLSSAIKCYTKQFTAIYTEPFPVGLERQPKAIFVGCIRTVGALETPIACGVKCDFVWNEKAKSASVKNIDGLTPSNTSYMWTLIVFE